MTVVWSLKIQYPLYRGRQPHLGLISQVRPSSTVAPPPSPAISSAPIRQNHTDSSSRPSSMCPALASKSYNFHHNVDVILYGNDEGFTGSNPKYLKKIAGCTFSSIFTNATLHSAELGDWNPIFVVPLINWLENTCMPVNTCQTYIDTLQISQRSGLTNKTIP